ncbi:MAG: PDZ domain-containing protein [Phycisphaerales bacterium]
MLAKNTRRILALIAVMACSTGPAHAQEAAAPGPVPVPQPAPRQRPPQDKPEDFLKLANQASAAFARGDYQEASGFLERQIALQPENGACWYNLALARSNLADQPGALQALDNAVDRGFSDRARILREPEFTELRKLDGFARIRDHWDQVLVAAGDRVLSQCRQEFGNDLREERDQELRTVFLTSADPTLVSRARAELHSVQKLADSIFGPDPDAGNSAWVVVVLPSRKGFEQWAGRTYGVAAKGTFQQIGGAYENSRKRLVAIDLGATLRHEFFHVVQYRTLERLGQQHPIWIMEGLASLAEDLEFPPTVDGRPSPEPPRPVTSWRTNIAQRTDRTGVYPSISQLAEMDQQKFSSSRPLANYAAARNTFMFLYSQRRLADWWQAYTTDTDHGLRADATGIKALEHVLGKPVKEIDKDSRVWLRTLSPVAETIEPGMASLGVEVEAGLGEGPVVTRVIPRPKGNVHQSAPGVRPGDTLLSIDGKPTRDLAELVRVLGTYAAGNEVLLEVRRGQAVKEFKVTLVAR